MSNYLENVLSRLNLFGKSRAVIVSYTKFVTCNVCTCYGVEMSDMEVSDNQEHSSLLLGFCDVADVHYIPYCPKSRLKLRYILRSVDAYYLNREKSSPITYRYST